MTKKPEPIADPENWNPATESFDDWLYRDRPSRLVSDLRTKDEKIRAMGYDKSYYEPENP